MIGLVLLGVLGVTGWNGDGGRFQPWAAVMAVVSFGAFLILFAVYWVGWLMYWHEVWRDDRRRPFDDTVVS